MLVKHNRLRNSITVALLALILLTGFSLRVWNINFDQGIGAHPDERSTVMNYALRMDLPQSWAEFWDAERSPLNPLSKRVLDPATGQIVYQPDSFTYGHFPLYLGVLMGEAFEQLAPVAERLDLPQSVVDTLAGGSTTLSGQAVAGRLVIALLDTLTILLLFFLGAAVYNRGAGLLAAALYAFTTQAIQLSHFFTVDAASTTFTVLTVLGGVWMVQRRSPRAMFLAALTTGIGIGLAVASKFSALPLLAVPVTAAILIWWDEAQQNREGSAGVQLRVLAAVLFAFGVAFTAFFLTSPYALLDWENFRRPVLEVQGRMVRGIDDVPWTRQYRGTTPYLYFIDQQLTWGFGLALGGVALAGALWAAWRLLASLWLLARTTFATNETPPPQRGLVEYTTGEAPSPLEGKGFGDGVRYSSNLLVVSSDQPALLPRDRLGEILAWSWVVPYFGITGAFVAKFNRYMSPVLPFLVLFAAGVVWVLWTQERKNKRLKSEDWVDAAVVRLRELEGSTPSPRSGGAASPNRFLRGLALLVAVVALGGGILWSTAYVNGVYGTAHPWNTAATWMAENVPAGSVILDEAWDDRLPMSYVSPEVSAAQQTWSYETWTSIEEDTPQKYELMRDLLQRADYVTFASKRNYGATRNLPERFPLTNLYYDAMFDEALGFELVARFDSPPQLFGYTFDDRHADESWSLYDHPQVHIFRKTETLSDAQFDAIFADSWQDAIPYYVGENPGSLLDPLYSALGLGGAQSSVASASNDEPSLLLERPLASLPVVDNYRWNVAASENEVLAVAWWWLVVGVLGWLAWPLCFALFRPLRDRGYLFSRGVGWLLAGWLLWLLASTGLALNTVANAWLTVALLGVVGLAAFIAQRRTMMQFVRERWGLLLVGEALFALAFVGFVLIRLGNPDLWHPWQGGEKFMEVAFLNGILRSPTFPPVDPHFAGGYINYYYFGLYLVAYLVKLTGIYAEVAFNLAIPTLFALTVTNAFGVAYSAVGNRTNQAQAEAGQNTQSSIFNLSSNWQYGLGAALLAPLFVTLIGNLDGFAQVVRRFSERAPTPDGQQAFRSAVGGVEALVRAGSGLVETLNSGQPLPGYDFWAPSRVIPPTINEFPYWSFLFADLHPHLIGIPFSVLFLALVLTLLRVDKVGWARGAALLAAFALLLGTLASVNLWELPTFAGLGVLALLVWQFRRGHIHWPATAGVAATYVGLAYLMYLPFFRTYTSPAVGGVGFVRAGDPPYQWLLVWGFLGFVVTSWLLFALSRPARPARPHPQTPSPRAGKGLHPIRGFRTSTEGMGSRPTALERTLSLALRRFDRLPRFVALHRRLVRRPSVLYLLALLAIPASLVLAAGVLLWGRVVLALCLPLLALAVLLLWRRGRDADAGSLFVALLVATGLALLAGTQVIYLKDHLAGSNAYRMNTVFKFFNQVWVLWGVAAAVAVPRMLGSWGVGELGSRGAGEQASAWVDDVDSPLAASQPLLRLGWSTAFGLLLAASLVFPVLGTRSRLDSRFPSGYPEVGTLNGLDFMGEAVFTWQPNDARYSTPATINLIYDRAAIEWLLDNVRGNAVIVESENDYYYQSAGTRIASFTGLSGLRGLHEGEQRYDKQLRPRHDLHNQFWNSNDPTRMMQIIDELDVALIYIGQLERYLHPSGVQSVEQMARDGLLQPLFQTEQTAIYGVPQQLVRGEDGLLYPAPVDAVQSDGGI